MIDADRNYQAARWPRNGRETPGIAPRRRPLTAAPTPPGSDRRVQTAGFRPPQAARRRCGPGWLRRDRGGSAGPGRGSPDVRTPAGCQRLRPGGDTPVADASAAGSRRRWESRRRAATTLRGCRVAPGRRSRRDGRADRRRRRLAGGGGPRPCRGPPRCVHRGRHGCGRAGTRDRQTGSSRSHRTLGQARLRQRSAMVPTQRFELWTSPLPRECSTPELCGRARRTLPNLARGGKRAAQTLNGLEARA